VGYDQYLTDNFVKSLPPFLERLTIADCRKSIFALLPALLAGDIPRSLRSITISFGTWSVDMAAMAALKLQTCAERRALEESASNRGIKLEWKYGASTSWPSQLGPAVKSTGQP
jgi:hypothetical protein